MTICKFGCSDSLQLKSASTFRRGSLGIFPHLGPPTRPHRIGGCQAIIDNESSTYPLVDGAGSAMSTTLNAVRILDIGPPTLGAGKWSWTQRNPYRSCHTARISAESNDPGNSRRPSGQQRVQAPRPASGNFPDNRPFDELPRSQGDRAAHRARPARRHRHVQGFYQRTLTDVGEAARAVAPPRGLSGWGRRGRGGAALNATG